NDETGEIYDADIEVNAANNTVTISEDPKKIEYDLQAILTHEVGHFIGIAHSPEPTAVMFASYSPGSIAQRKLTPDDVKAVCAIYPPNSGVVCNVEPKGGFSDTCEAPPEAKSCAVAAPHSPAGAGSTTSSLAFMGLGILAVTRFARRRSQGRRSR